MKSPVVPYPDINSMLANVVDRRRWGLYDRVMWRAGESTPHEILCFGNAVGKPAWWDRSHICTYADTNMRTAEMLQPPYDAVGRRFLFVFESGSLDAEQLIRNYAWEFWIMEKAFQREPVLTCSVRGEMADLIEGFGDEPEHKTDEYPFVRLAPFARRFAFDCGELAKFIPPLCQFRVKLVGSPIAPKTELNFYTIIDGSLDAAVQ